MVMRLHSISVPVTSEALHGSILRFVLLNIFINAMEEVTEHTLFKPAKHQNEGSCLHLRGRLPSGRTCIGLRNRRTKDLSLHEKAQQCTRFPREAVLPPSLQFPSCGRIKPRAAWSDPRANCLKQGVGLQPS